MALNTQRLSAIVKKETIQMVRDWPTLLMIILMPVIELMLFAYVGDLTLDHLPTAVADMSRDSNSRAFINALEVSSFFDVVEYVNSENEVIRAIDEGRVNVGLVIPPDFAGRIARGTAQALVIIDGSDAFVVQSGYSAALAIAQVHGMQLMLQTAAQMGMAGMGQLPINTSTRILYNPNIDQIVFLIPGLAAMLLQLIGVNATVMAVVRERELGTMEQMLVTPARPLELILGKIVPPIALIAVDLLIIILLGVYWFKVPIRGSLWLFSWLSLLFIISGLGMGLALSTISKNQKQAQQISAVVMMLSILLTGLIYPRATMPPLVRTIGNLIPATYFVRIARGIMTKGVGLAFMWEDVLALAIYGAIIVALSTATFKKRLD
ncbi:MAG TPA: ABC transporter permease [Anaerolineae bacterium]|nr:ABC transporter permease [Anaerolineae bacterium]HQI86664.1 ABC transporter permease [Anaerolineae bacterium]HQK13446.1 ABC transporter permease [Anaerolineae bacterium]